MPSNYEAHCCQVTARVHWTDLPPVRLFWRVLSTRFNRLSDGRELTVSAGRLSPKHMSVQNGAIDVRQSDATGRMRLTSVISPAHAFIPPIFLPYVSHPFDVCQEKRLSGQGLFDPSIARLTYVKRTVLDGHVLQALAKRQSHSANFPAVRQSPVWRMSRKTA